MNKNSPLSGLKIAVLGAGNMGQALVRGLVEKSVYPQNIVVFDVDAKKLASLKKSAHIKVAKSNRQCVSLADVVILAVKPQIIEDVVKEIASSVAKDALVISIAAGVTISRIEGFFTSKGSDEKIRIPAVIRVMPNMPALVGAGMSAYSLGRHASAKHKKVAEGILVSLGDFVAVPEKMLDLVTAISGSGPAYYFLLSEKLIEAAYELGMKVDVAKKLVYQTAFGSGKILMESGEDPEVLIERVASKKGTTEAALEVYKKMGFGKVVHEAVKAAQRRSKEISKGQ